MIGNNSCGVHSVQSEFYGPGVRTEDNVHELEILTYDGVRMRVGETSDDGSSASSARGRPAGRDLPRACAISGTATRTRSAQRLPQIPRRVSGYNLPELLPENGFHVARALVGTESTCVTILEATVTLARAFPGRALLMLGYEDIVGRGRRRDAGARAQPAADRDRGHRRHLAEFMPPKAPPPAVPARAAGRAGLAAGRVRRRHARRGERGGPLGREADAPRRQAGRRAAVHTDRERSASVWQVRESGLGATAFIPGRQRRAGRAGRTPPSRPRRSDDYLRELRRLFDRYDYDDRPLRSLRPGLHPLPDRLRPQPAERASTSTCASPASAADLVVRYGGSLSAASTATARRGANCCRSCTASELVQAFREFKAIWDPDGAR